MGECIKDNVPVTDNTMLDCDEILSTECTVHNDPMLSLLLPSGKSISEIFAKLDKKITKISNRAVKNLIFENETSLVVQHNRGYLPLIQFKTLLDTDWSVVYDSTNQFTITFLAPQSDVLIYI